ncbi:unnamed protein product [Urochloa humidicola]
MLFQMPQRAWPVSYSELVVLLTPVHVLMLVTLGVIALAMLWRARRPRDVYLVDYGCFLGEPRHRVPLAMAVEHLRHMPWYVDEESASFMLRLYERSGIGEETSVPDSFRYLPPERGVEASCEEAELVIFSAVDKVFSRTTATVKPEDIDTVIVACSFTTLTPAFADVVANRYGLRADVRCVNLSGMGCSGALICVGLARNLLRAAPPGKTHHVLIVSTEILSSMFYTGTKREMLVPNVLFRMGAAAMVMSNSPERARFRLGPIVRTLTAARDADYRCAFQEEDDEGITGINLSKDLPVVAANALKGHIISFGPAVLPVHELLRVAFSFLKHRFLKHKLYRPAFHKVFRHFCIHPGGRRVLDEVQRGLGLSDADMEASRMTLHRFGNMASSSLLYELAYIEAKGWMQEGDRVCMISFSPGIDCSSVVWECIKPPAEPNDGPWAGCVHRYPVQLPRIVKRS